MPNNAKALPEERQRARVMIVDDSPGTLRSLIMLLHHFGFEVWGFLDEEEAISAATKYDPDVLICDAHMEEITDTEELAPEEIKGIEVASTIQRILPRCEVIVMSGNLNPGVIQDRAKRIGAKVRVMSKPTDPAALLSELRVRKAA